MAYWRYGAEEMDKVPAHVWRDSWLAKQRREADANDGTPRPTSAEAR